jgi:hypothetical protein
MDATFFHLRANEGKEVTVLGTRRVSHREDQRHLLAGISRRFDIVVFFDGSRFVSIKNRARGRSIFVFSGGVTPNALLRFIENLKADGTRLKLFVLAGSDRTFPRQVDQRQPSNGPGALVTARKIVASLQELNCSLWVENLDTEGLGIHALPTGFVPEGKPGRIKRVTSKLGQEPIYSNHPRALLFQRVRDGTQWETRRTVERIAKSRWNDFVDVYDANVSPKRYRQILNTYPFNICVEGGGLDPSPKAFESLWAGTIPIIKRNPTTEAYSALPVVVLEDWVADALNEDLIREWLAKFRRDWPDWSVVRHRLSEAYWWKKMNRMR